jgi:predicted nucleic acid-binding protein
MDAYDATFIALAEALDAPLITCDATQADATGHQARVEVFG